MHREGVADDDNDHDLVPVKIQNCGEQLTTLTSGRI